MRLIRLLQHCVNSNQRDSVNATDKKRWGLLGTFDILSASAGFAASKLLCRLYITLQIVVE
jgi:hypothetical protein